MAFLPQLDTVSPGNELTPEVNVGISVGEIPQGICIHHPAIVGHDIPATTSVHDQLNIFQKSVMVSVESEISVHN